MWTIDEVKVELNKLCAADGLPEMTIPVYANKRFTRTLGRVRAKYNHPVQIDFSQDLLDHGTDNDVILDDNRAVTSTQTSCTSADFAGDIQKIFVPFGAVSLIVHSFKNLLTKISATRASTGYGGTCIEVGKNFRQPLGGFFFQYNRRASSVVCFSSTS